MIVEQYEQSQMYVLIEVYLEKRLVDVQKNSRIFRELPVSDL